MSSFKQPYHHTSPFDSGFLQVSSLHKIHYEQYGLPTGKPALFVHGGPGGSATKAHTIFFDPEIYRVVLFDQRGAGKSLPAAELRENTAQLLVEDIEALRTHCGVEKWTVVFGGSWGSCLSMMYAQTYPERVGSLILRGVFTERAAELRFSRGLPDGGGAARIFPEVYERFLSHLAPEARKDPIRGYFELVTSDDYETRLTAAREWNRWDMTMSRLVPDPDEVDAKDEVWLLQHARLETWYAINGGFVEDGHLLKEASLEKIRHIPCSIINGRYDLFCPPQTAWELHRGLPGSRLYIIEAAGHSQFEPGIQQKLIEVCDEHAKLEV